LGWPPELLYAPEQRRMRRRVEQQPQLQWSVDSIPNTMGGRNGEVGKTKRERGGEGSMGSHEPPIGNMSGVGCTADGGEWGGPGL
jgi:hypothetical protein